MCVFGDTLVLGCFWMSYRQRIVKFEREKKLERKQKEDIK